MGKEVDQLLTLLQHDNSLKTWSLIITFFGDVVVARGGNVSAKTVQTVMSGMNVGGGAVRTAFSRLVSDQWVARQKIGRESFYELADNGYRPFAAASARIYSSATNAVCDSSNWTIVIGDANTSDSELLKNAAQIHAYCWLLKGASQTVSDSLASDKYLVLSGELNTLPDWLKSKLVPDKLTSGYQLLQKRFATVEDVGSLSALDKLIVRCLLIHTWRRLLLRAPAFPGELSQSELNCRRFVADLYHRLLPGSESWLDEHATCAKGQLPVINESIKHRFTEQFR